MPIVNQHLEGEMAHISRPEELTHIRTLFDSGDELMQELAYALISGNDNDVGNLTKQALDQGYQPNVVLDDGLIAGMAVVGIK